MQMRQALKNQVNQVPEPMDSFSKFRGVVFLVFTVTLRFAYSI